MMKKRYLTLFLLGVFSCERSIESQIEEKRLELKELADEMKDVTYQAYVASDMKSDAVALVERMKALGTSETDPDYVRALSQEREYSRELDSLLLLGDRLSIQGEKLASEIDSLITLL